MANASQSAAWNRSPTVAMLAAKSGMLGEIKNDGMAPVIEQTPKEEEAADKILRGRTLIGLLMTIALVTMIFFSNGQVMIVLGGLLLLLICAIGMRGAVRRQPYYLDLYWRGLYVWTVLGWLLVVFYLLSDSYGMRPFAEERCQQVQLVIDGVCPNATCTPESGKVFHCPMPTADQQKLDPLCVEQCVPYVKRDLEIIMIGFAAILGIFVIIFAHRARNLAQNIRHVYPEEEPEKGDDYDEYDDAAAGQGKHPPGSSSSRKQQHQQARRDVQAHRPASGQGVTFAESKRESSQTAAAGAKPQQPEQPR